MLKYAPTAFGHIFYHDTDIYIGKSLEVYGEWSYEEIELFEVLAADGFMEGKDTIIEAGANIGSHTLALGKSFPVMRTLAYEASLDNFMVLCANIAINGAKNILPYHYALGEVRGEARFARLNTTQAGNFGGVSLSHLENAWAEVYTPLMRLDDVVLPEFKVGLFKIDVEGLELEVLNGARAIIERDKPLIYVENDRFDKSDALIEALEALGYQLYWHITPLFRANNFRGHKENIFGGFISCNMLGVHASIARELKGMQRVVAGAKHPLLK